MVSIKIFAVIIFVIGCMGIPAVLADQDLIVNVPNIPTNTAVSPEHSGLVTPDGTKNLKVSSSLNIKNSTETIKSDSVSINAAGDFTLISRSTAGIQGNGNSGGASISADNRYVAFQSDATNLVAGDTNSATDIFVHDRTTGATTRVSVDSSGNQGIYEYGPNSINPSISSNGQYIVFESVATNLVPEDTNEVSDIFVHDRITGTTTRVSVDSSGNEGSWGAFHPSISADGRYVAFDTSADNLVSGDTNEDYDIFVYDRTTGITERVSVDSSGNQGNADSEYPFISEDGRYVAYESMATNLVPGDIDNGMNGWDIYLYDRVSKKTTLISRSTAGIQGNERSGSPRISADNRYVSFASHATNLVSGDTNGYQWDLFLHDRITGKTTMEDVNSEGIQVDIDAGGGSMSSDNRYIVINSRSTNLVPDDTNGVGDAFVRDRASGTTTRVSVLSDGTQANDISSGIISSDGQYMVIFSYASNLIAGDTNRATDIFIHKITFPKPTITSISPKSGQQGGTLKITITGTNFEPKKSTISVSGSGVKIVKYADRTDKKIIVYITIAKGTKTGARTLKVTNPTSGNADTHTFTVTAAPKITKISPSNGPQGGKYTITITGTNFEPKKSTISVSGSGAKVVKYGERTNKKIVVTLTVSKTAKVGPRVVTVKNPTYGGVATGTFTVGTLPTIKNISPSSGSKSTKFPMTITGTNFEPKKSTVSISGSGVKVKKYTTQTDKKIVVQLSVAKTATTGIHTVTVLNPTSGLSAKKTFTVKAKTTSSSVSEGITDSVTVMQKPVALNPNAPEMIKPVIESLSWSSTISPPAMSGMTGVPAIP